MKLDWKRIARTAIQAASGAGVALITTLSADFSKDAIIVSCVEFACTVLVAVLMNINKQSIEQDQDGDSEDA